METSFGDQLKVLQGKLKATAIARNALPRATDEEITQFANYFSRITHGHVRSVGYDYLRLIAAGFGFVRLSEFFRHLEMGLPMEEIRAQDLRSPGRGEADEPQAQNEDDRRTISYLAKNMLEAQEALAAYLKEARDDPRPKDLRQDRHPRSPTAKHTRIDGQPRRQPLRRSAKRRPGK